MFWFVGALLIIFWVIGLAFKITFMQGRNNSPVAP